jgi:hypothetical protein
MLTPATDDAKELAQMCPGRFSGDPAHEFEATRYNTTNDEETEEGNTEGYKVIHRNLIKLC